MTEEYSKLTNLEERIFALDPYFLAPVAIVLALQITLILMRHLKSSNTKHENIYYIYAIKCALTSAVCTLFVGILKVFFCTDLFFPWNYDKLVFVTLVGSFANIIYFIGKILFYFSFTFHIQSILYNNHRQQMSTFLRLWMLLVSICIVILCPTYLVDDAVSNTKKEIGISAKHNIYISMYLGHDGTLIANIAMFGIMIVDFLYIGILIYYYMTNIKQIEKSNLKKESIKGLILVVISSLLFCIAILFVAINMCLKYVFCGIAIISDDVCLFLMFKCSKEIYDNFCGCLCNDCCSKMVYGPNYNDIITNIQTNIQDDNTDNL